MIRFAKTNREIASVISARMGSIPSGTSSSKPSAVGANFGWTHASRVQVAVRAEVLPQVAETRLPHRSGGLRPGSPAARSWRTPPWGRRRSAARCPPRTRSGGLAANCSYASLATIVRRLTCGSWMRSPALVDGEPKPAPDLLALAVCGARLVQRADLEDVGVVPAFAECRVAEDEPQRLVDVDSSRSLSRMMRSYVSTSAALSPRVSLGRCLLSTLK